MKRIIIILFLFLTCVSQAATYYVKVSGGTGSGADDANAWSYAKLNATILSAGDNVLFKRGDVFFGALNVGASGNNSNRITYGAYGNGAAPIISGLTNINSWTSLGSNKYQASVNSGTKLNLVIRDSAILYPARYPNADASNEGYLTVDNHTPSSSITEGVTTNTITDAALSSAITWTTAVGAEIAIVNNNFTRDVAQVTGFTTNTVSWIAVSQQPATNGFGYFIQNHPLAIDQQNEWYYNSVAQTLQIYSGTAPSNVSYGAVETLVDLNGRSFITFRDIQFIGADSMAVHIGASHHNTFSNCKFLFNGTEAASVGNSESANHIIIDSNSINHTNSFAILMYHCDSCKVTNNDVRNSGMLPGMGKIGAGGYGGIGVNGDTVLIQKNNIGGCGGSAIGASGRSVKVLNNSVNDFCRVFTDQGGIYMQASGPAEIISNVVTNGFFGLSGTDGFLKPHGIYLDEGQDSTLVQGNTVFNVPGNSFYGHEVRNTTLRGNFFFEGHNSQITFQNDDATNRGYNNKIVSNLLYSSGISMPLINISKDSASVTRLVNSADSNTYFRPLNPYGSIITQLPSINQSYDHVGWFNRYGYDQHGSQGPAIDRYNITSIGSNFFSNSSFNSSTTGVSAGDVNSTISLVTALDGSAVKTSSTAGVGTILNTNVSFGALPGGRTYRITFSLLGTTNTENLIIKFINTPSSYQYFGDTYYAPLRTTRTEDTVYVTTDGSKSNMTMVLENRSTGTDYYLDNVFIQELTSFSTTNIDDVIRLEYNATKSTRTAILPGIYKDMRNNAYSGSIDVAPYSSALLQKIADLPAVQTYKFKGRILIQ